MTLHADAVSTLSRFPGQDALREAYLGFLAAREDACLRSCEPGHITASALVLDATAEHALLTLHPRVGRWLQLGGHCEPEDVSLSAAALREATEESGMRGLRIEPAPIHLDVHPITCSLGKPTRHFDVRFLVRAPVGAQPVRSAESVDLQWWPLDGLPDNVDDLHPLIESALARLR
ncbi:NUDIX hydrolase [Lentzea jiangxiensis]|uniref:8-oxo-dGTP pyrophosphatase MutT, NUDIX family n=1 Tax=Lentzea jiangxiensis TaxID=641025 RepID=A0A1H0EVZ7_9PSEU|nr:NUDIX domain-containing protein [Lentzea jiangxiensis]SDN86449.1 8-oxo-dGTP pyrophosphatase MutT, NUDIX family [Lentzea jiangxiensis]